MLGLGFGTARIEAAVWDEAVPGPTDAASPSWKDEDREGHYISVLGRTSLRDGKALCETCKFGPFSHDGEDWGPLPEHMMRQARLLGLICNAAVENYLGSDELSFSLPSLEDLFSQHGSTQGLH